LSKRYLINTLFSSWVVYNPGILRHLYVPERCDLLFVFGRYEADLAYSDADVTLTATRSGALPRYTRSCRGHRVEKILPDGKGTIVINPVEPVNLPVPVTRYLEITFPPVVLPPRTGRTVHLTFPLEIGVFLEAAGGIHVLDLFSLLPVKYSLYGSPGAGIITRWHESGISEECPVVDRFRYGILELAITNAASEVIEISRAVFDSNSMHLWYGESVVMTGVMDVYSPMIARTTIAETVPKGRLEKSIELYAAARIPSVHGRGYLMEYGVA